MIRMGFASPELVPLFTVLLVWGSLCFPLTYYTIRNHVRIMHAWQLVSP